MPKAKLAFPEFNGNNPRGWIRRCNNFLNLYKVLEAEKITYIAINIRDQIRYWYDLYMIDNEGEVSWAQFYFDICQRYGDWIQ